jgi:hypothetical protein
MSSDTALRLISPWRGTEGSNPSPSSSESGANLSFLIIAVVVACRRWSVLRRAAFRWLRLEGEIDIRVRVRCAACVRADDFLDRGGRLGFGRARLLSIETSEPIPDIHGRTPRARTDHPSVEAPCPGPGSRRTGLGHDDPTPLPVPRSDMGQEERFPQTTMSAGCGFRKETIVGMRRNGRDAPIPAVRGTKVEPIGPAVSGHSPVRHRSSRPRTTWRPLPFAV